MKLADRRRPLTRAAGTAFSAAKCMPAEPRGRFGAGVLVEKSP